MRPNDHTERDALNDAGLRIRMVGQQLKSEGIDPKAKVSYDVFMASMDTIKEALGELSQRITALEKRVDGMTGCMKYRGEWHAGYEFDDGDLVEHAGGLHLAVQPIHDNQPPSRSNGWVQLTGA